MKKFLSKIKAISTKVWGFITGAYKKIDTTVDNVGPFVIKAINALKVVNNSRITDALQFIITSAIPGTVDDKFATIARKWLTENLPIIAADLDIVKNIADIKDTNLQLQAIADAIYDMKFTNPTRRADALHRFAKEFLAALADGKITLNEAGSLIYGLYEIEKEK